MLQFRVNGILIRNERPGRDGGAPYVNFEIAYLGGVRPVDVDKVREAEFSAVCGQKGDFTGEIVRREWRDKANNLQSRDSFLVKSFKADK